MECTRQCLKENALYSRSEHELAQRTMQGVEALTVERIEHKARRRRVEARALVYAPVGNTTQFVDLVPRVAFIGFSTSPEAMKVYTGKLHDFGDPNQAAVYSSFSGSPELRRNIRRYSQFLELDRMLGCPSDLSSMFCPSQRTFLYTQIIRCCSVGRTSESSEYHNSSAIYPRNIVKPDTRKLYLTESGHAECIRTVFMKDMARLQGIPLILVFRPAWETLNAMNLVRWVRAYGIVVDWVPHPSDPGRFVSRLLDTSEQGGDLEGVHITPSVRQLIDLRKRISQISRSSGD